jgi:hypothetical protein
MTTRFRLQYLSSNLITMLCSILIISASGCEFINNLSPSVNETDLNTSVEATINAERNITQAAQVVIDQTASALQATIDAQATSLAQIPTQEPVQTEEPTIAPSDTPEATQAPIDSTAIPITDWSMLYWRPLSSGCHFKDQMCWKLFDDYKTTQGWAEAVLTSKTSVQIEENWPSPYLVYWNERDLRFAARLVLHVDGTPIKVKDLSKTKSNWQQDFISLEEYKGQQVIVQFISNVGEKYISSWFIQNVQIVPDFTP